jgi:hypothetical protein
VPPLVSVVPWRRCAKSTAFTMGRVRMLAGEGAEVGGGAGTTEIEHAECLVACTQARFLAIWLTDLGANPSLHDTQSAPIA